jgi:hypothetical protein
MVVNLRLNNRCKSRLEERLLSKRMKTLWSRNLSIEIKSPFNTLKIAQILKMRRAQLAEWIKI